MKEQYEAQLAALKQAHTMEVAALQEQLAEARLKAAGSADQARAVAEDIAALKAALAVVQEEQRVRFCPLYVASSVSLDNVPRQASGVCWQTYMRP